MNTRAPKSRITRRRLVVIGGLGLGVLILAAVAYVVFDPLGGAIGDPFSQEIAGLPAATRNAMVELRDGATFELKVSPVQKRIGTATVRMLAYNGSVPGPTLRVAQGAAVTVKVTNQTDLATTIHWHGLRLDNRFDGVPEVTQVPIAPGQSFTYHLRFPDAGVYWYHPHIREDYTQAAGLYGNIVVVPSEAGYWAPASREQALILSDILLEGGKLAPVSRSTPHRVAMGRFGNTLLVNGEPEYALAAGRGDVLRLYLTDTANARPFAFRIPGARMKLVGGDSGRMEREQFVDEVVLAPAERAVVDVLFDRVGRLTIEHRTPDHTYVLGSVTVSERPAAPAFEQAFWTLRTNPDFAAFRAGLAADLARPADKTLSIVGEMAGMGHAAHEAGNEAGSIEWDDTMAQMNRDSTPQNMAWKLIDRQTGAQNDGIQWHLHVGDRVKITIVNELDSDHLMQHPFHIHGQRFVVLSHDGAPTNNLVWKDTVLVRTGETVEILLDVSNPGTWMAHCHIAEHLESGMMFHFHVTGTSRVGDGVRRSPGATPINGG